MQILCHIPEPLIRFPGAMGTGILLKQLHKDSVWGPGLRWQNLFSYSIWGVQEQGSVYDRGDIPACWWQSHEGNSTFLGLPSVVSPILLPVSTLMVSLQCLACGLRNSRIDQESCWGNMQGQNTSFRALPIRTLLEFCWWCLDIPLSRIVQWELHFQDR